MARGKQLKGLRDLVFDAIEATTNLVEETHARSAQRVSKGLNVVPALGAGAQPVEAVHEFVAKSVYQSVRAVSRGVQGALRLATDPLFDLAERSDSLDAWSEGAAPWIDRSQAAINGFCGNHLAASGNGLALDMTLRSRGRALELTREALRAAYPHASSRVAVFTHGLSCSEHIWDPGPKRDPLDLRVNFATELERDLGYTPVFVRYNSGNHVSENGRALAALLERFVQAYPCPVQELALIGHSMGGLVSRSAAHYASEAGLSFVPALKHVVCLGSPHLGAPLEKGVHWLSVLLRAFPTAGTEVPATILNARSYGIKDLRYGYTVDEEWLDRDLDRASRDDRLRLAPLPGVAYAYLAATFTQDAKHPAGVLLGDVLVQLPSAMGQASEPARHIPFRGGRVFAGMNHFELVDHPDVYRALCELLGTTVLPDVLPRPLEDPGAPPASSSAR